MSYARFTIFNLVGAAAWVVSLCLGGYWLGNLPWVKQNLSLLIIGIIVVSLLPVVIGWLKHRSA
jgi:membrane-associated protein